MNYEKYVEIAKALADSKRVKILDMISCEKMCACDILEHFHFTQPTFISSYESTGRSRIDYY